MQNTLKAIVLSLGALSTIGLTACQSSNATTAPSVSKSTVESHESHKRNFDHKRKHHEKLTDEERAQKHAHMQQRFEAKKQQREQLDKACDGKINQTIAVKVGEKTVQGTCKVTFQPNKTAANISKN